MGEPYSQDIVAGSRTRASPSYLALRPLSISESCASFEKSSVPVLTPVVFAAVGSRAASDRLGNRSVIDDVTSA
jgi:hypothetical protein